jgi:uncharacterized repeat protein (TIGR03837 family)
MSGFFIAPADGSASAFLSMTVPRSFDIFCRIIDNYGDVGVCWRLARQLAAEHGLGVRLWVDDLARLHLLCPAVDPGKAHQRAAGVEIMRWQAEMPAVVPADIVVEAFGCGLPEGYAEAMAARDAPLLWIVLEYLSAEPWVREHHGLPSPHPRLPLQRYFFFPGFVPGTGGVLREAGLFARRAAFAAAGKDAFWGSVGFELPPAGTTTVSLFGYAHAPLAGLLDVWARGDRPIVAAVPEGTMTRPVMEFLGTSAAPGHCSFRRGSLEVRLLPFVEQTRYDELLWACDCNFVRGEDSFVRAQWAARPFVWHIYPQQEGVHWRKLEAFLGLYCTGLPTAVAEAVGVLWRTWNSEDASQSATGAAWQAYWRNSEVLQAYAPAWAEQVAGVGDLAGKLAQFCQDRLK